LVNQLLKAAAGIDFNTLSDRLVVNSSAFFLPSSFSLQSSGFDFEAERCV
jgi:hypothetical protein